MRLRQAFQAISLHPLRIGIYSQVKTHPIDETPLQDDSSLTIHSLS
jgi:hypothetical protein